MGTKDGGAKAAATNKRKYGDGFYGRIGAIGGRNYDRITSPPKGFAAHPQLAAEAGRKGGRISKRTKSTYTEMRQEAATA